MNKKKENTKIIERRVTKLRCNVLSERIDNNEPTLPTNTDEFKKLIKYILRMRRYSEGPWGIIWRTSYPFELIPHHFLKFARREIKRDTEENRVNSLSNIKRAIDCQVELLIHACGYNKKGKKENWTFPQKIEFLKEVGLTAPEILVKINRMRNKLEHEYKIPDMEEIEDALGVTELFISYTDKFVNRINAEFIKLYKNGEICINYQADNSIIVIEVYYIGYSAKYVLDYKNDNFLKILKLCINYLKYA